MTNRFTGDPASDVLILGPVVRRIAREHRVGEAEARAWLEEALRFLVRAAEAGRMIEPGIDADRAWHEFILFTRGPPAPTEETAAEAAEVAAAERAKPRGVSADAPGRRSAARPLS